MTAVVSYTDFKSLALDIYDGLKAHRLAPKTADFDLIGENTHILTELELPNDVEGIYSASAVSEVGAVIKEKAGNMSLENVLAQDMVSIIPVSDFNRRLMVLEDKVIVLTAGMEDVKKTLGTVKEEMEDVKKTLGTVKEEIVTAVQDSVRNAVQEIQQEAVGGKRNRLSK